MAVKGKEVKGKQVAGKGSSGKRKRDDAEKSAGRKRKNPGVLQFFDVAADVDDEEGDEDESEDDLFGDDDDFWDNPDAELKHKNEAGKSHHLPFIPKEEELSDEELAELLEERYRPGSKHVVYAKGDYEAKSSLAGNGLMPSDEDPTIWRVKCMVGRERYSVFCLVQKYVDLQSLGTNLQTISAFAVEHAKGYIFIEAYREFDVIEACKGLCSIYSSRLTPVPRNEVSHLFQTRSKTNEVSVGSWARMKYGIYKGDLTQVVAVNAKRKRATVKLIPRIDLQAIAKKLSGEGTVKRTCVPAPRLISSSELEDFEKHIQYRHDRESGLYFKTIDGLMLKDGYLFKRVSIESLCCWNVVPSADELQRFEASKEDQSDDTEWLLGLYGEGRRKCSEKSDNGKTNVSKGTSGSMHGSGFELHDLVFFSESDVGIIIGMEESDRFQILKDSEGGIETVTVELDELRSGFDDRKFTPLDHNMEIISINDVVSVLEGPFKDRQGIIKQIYKGTLFIYDENLLESSGCFCAKSQFCEKLKRLKHDASQENVDDGPGPPGFQDSTSSPKSTPSSPKSSPPRKPWVARGNSRDSNNNFQGDRDGIFSIGQTVRIKVGPLKGYLCRVIAIYRSNVTVKLDCQLKIMSVKCEHLSEVRAKTCGESFRDPASNAENGNQGWSTDLMDGKGTFGESKGWNSSGLSTGRNSWSDLSASGFSNDSPFTNPFQSDPKKGEGDDAWGSKLGSATGNKTTDSWGTAIGSREDQKSAWDNVATNNKAMDADNDKVGNWGGGADCWDKPTAEGGVGGSKSEGWEKAKVPTEGKAGCSSNASDGWDKGKGWNASQSEKWGGMKENREGEPVDQKKSNDLWHKGEVGRGNHSSGWNSDAVRHDRPNSWDKGKQIDINDGWALDSQAKSNSDNAKQEDSWGKAADTWKGKGTTTGSRTDWNSATTAGSWGNAADCSTAKGDQGNSWNKDRGWSASQSGERSNVKENHEIEPMGWKKSGDPWDKVEQGNGNHTSDWNTENLSQNQQNSWRKGKNIDESEGGGGRALDCGGKENTDKVNLDDPWGKAADTWKAKDGSSGSKTDCWNSATASGGWNASQSENRGGTSGGWNGPRASGTDETLAWRKGGATENETDGRKDQNGCWSKPKSFGSGRGFDWNKERVENKDGWGNRGQEDSWDKQKTFDGGRGSGGRRGRGGNRGGRGNFSRGRSYGGNDEGSKWNTSTGSSGSQAGWNNGLNGSDSGGGDGWNNTNVSSEDQHTDWKSGTSDMGGNQASGWEKGSNWNVPKASNENQSSGSQGGESGAGGNQSGWDKSSWSTPKVSAENPAVWNQGFGAKEADGHRDQGRSSGPTRGGFEYRGRGRSNQSSGWGRGRGSRGECSFKGEGWGGDGWKSETSDMGGNQASGWDGGSDQNISKASNDIQSSGWQRGESDAAGNQSGWDKSSWSTPKDSAGNPAVWNQGFGAKEADGHRDQGRSSGPTREGFEFRGRGRSNQSSGWGRGRGSGEEGSFKREGWSGDGWNNSNVSSEDQHTGWKSGTSDIGGNQASGWDRGSNRNISKASNENQSSGWQRGESDAGGIQSGWDNSSWSTPKDSAGNPAVWNQGFGASEADGLSDQRRTSGTTRGGFEYRGRGRSNHSSGWGRGRGSGEEGSFRRNSNTNDNERGWGSSGPADSWNQGDGFGNRGRGRRDQSGGRRGRGRGFGREGSFNWKQNNGDGQGDCASSWNQGSDAGKEQWQGWSAGHGGQSRDGGGSSEAGGASSLGKGKDENPWGNASGSWGASSLGNRKDENPGGDVVDSLGAGSLGKGKDENTWGNTASSWGASSSGKGKDNQWGNAAGSWGKGGDDGGAKSGW
ncbi:protein RNA-directed DNA methylation 3 isoform X2 [Macadamia integrifolia]|uniref:protein RNA-directed DNA methylation 3 isoform X2 n=1 Tax=Macadamia integrifolia TaxID=60698 RepID=UPI001C4F2AF7|nr:protein RNA-directed DNA methylation 3 isoform X2 [Macadamia integrifolia]